MTKTLHISPDFVARSISYEVWSESALEKTLRVDARILYGDFLMVTYAKPAESTCEQVDRVAIYQELLNHFARESE